MLKTILLGLFITSMGFAQSYLPENTYVWSTRYQGKHIENYYYPLKPISGMQRIFNDQELSFHKLNIHSYTESITKKNRFLLKEYDLNFDHYRSLDKYQELKSMYSLMKYTIESALVDHDESNTRVSQPNYYHDDIADSVTIYSYNREELLSLKTSGFYNLVNSQKYFSGIITQTDLNVINQDTKSLQFANNEMGRKQVKWFQTYATGKAGSWKIKESLKNGHLPDENCQYYFDKDAEISGATYRDRVYNYRETLCGTVYINFWQKFENPELLLKTIRDNFITSLRMYNPNAKAPSVMVVFDFSGYYNSNDVLQKVRHYQKFYNGLALSPLREGMDLKVTPRVFFRINRNQLVMKLVHANKSFN